MPPLESVRVGKVSVKRSSYLSVVLSSWWKKFPLRPRGVINISSKPAPKTREPIRLYWNVVSRKEPPGSESLSITARLESFDLWLGATGRGLKKSRPTRSIRRGEKLKVIVRVWRGETMKSN